MKGIITIILLIVLVAIIMFFDFPAYNKVNFLKNEIEKYEQFLTEKEELLVKVVQLKEIYESREEEINKVYYALPSSTDIPNLIVQFEALASENGLILGNLSFSQVEAAKKTNRVTWGGGAEEETAAVEVEALGSYQNLGVSLSLTGSYKSFKSFLKALEYNIRLMDIKSIGFSSAEAEKGEEEEEVGVPTYTFAVSLEAYYR